MCYWPLSTVNLTELVPVLGEWLVGLLPQARRAAEDLFGCRGAWFSGVCDLRHIGNADDLCFGWSGAGAWMAQVLWQYYEHTGDQSFLERVLYPLLKEVALFYEDYLVAGQESQLIPVPSASPEMGIKGRRRYNALASPSTIDLELIQDALTHAVAASDILDVDRDQRNKWASMVERVPLPAVDEHGCLQEWLERHEPIDPCHRHRSPFVGLAPGDRITLEDTPEYQAAARKLLAVRQSNRATTCALASAWDAQLLARCYEGDSVLEELELIAKTWLIDNLLLAICDWREESSTLNWFPGRKVFQIEASIGLVAGIAEMFLQDRRGLLRLLPALPKAWPDGQVKGLRGRGGFEVDLKWERGRLVEAEIRSLRGELCRVKSFTTPGGLNVFHDGEKQGATHDGDVMSFPTEPGATYTLRPKVDASA